jgi:hypothetical protein
MVKAPPVDETRGVSARSTRQRETASRPVRVKTGTGGAPTKLFAEAGTGLTTLPLYQAKQARNLRAWKLVPTLSR